MLANNQVLFYLSLRTNIVKTAGFANKSLLKHVLTGIPALAFSCASLQASAFGTASDMGRSPLQAEFERLDGNHDNSLSREEASHDHDLAGNFDHADRNRNGLLASEEYTSFKSALQQKRMKEFLDDSTVTAKVKAELVKDAGMKGLKISVETYKGKVILSGFVENSQQLRRALQIASGIRGVQSVTNGLIVKG